MRSASVGRPRFLPVFFAAVAFFAALFGAFFAAFFFAAFFAVFFAMLFMGWFGGLARWRAFECAHRKERGSPPRFELGLRFFHWGYPQSGQGFTFTLAEFQALWAPDFKSCGNAFMF